MCRKLREIIPVSEWKTKNLVDLSQGSEINPSENKDDQLQEELQMEKIDSKLQQLRSKKEKISEDQIEKLLEKSKAEGWVATVSDEELENILKELRKKQGNQTESIPEK